MIRPLHRPLAEDLARARRELNVNPTITRYQMVDGRELRQRVEPWPSFRRSLETIGDAMRSFARTAETFSARLQTLIEARPETTVRRPTGFVRSVDPLLLSVRDGLSPVEHICEYSDPNQCGWPGHRRAGRKPVVLPARFDTTELGVASLLRHHGVEVRFRHPDLDAFDAALADYEARLDAEEGAAYTCPHGHTGAIYCPQCHECVCGRCRA